MVEGLRPQASAGHLRVALGLAGRIHVADEADIAAKRQPADLPAGAALVGPAGDFPPEADRELSRRRPRTSARPDNGQARGRRRAGRSRRRKAMRMNQSGGWASIRRPSRSSSSSANARRRAVDVDDVGDGLRRGCAIALERFARRVRTMSRKPMRRPRKAGDRLLIGGIEDDRRGAACLQRLSRATRSAGKADRDPALRSSSVPSLARSSRVRRRFHPFRAGQRMGDRDAHVGRCRAGRAPSHRHIRPSNGSPTADGRQCRSGPTAGRTDDAPRSARAPCSSSSPNRRRSWRPSTSWGGRPPARASRRASGRATIRGTGRRWRSGPILRHRIQAIAGKALENRIMLAVDRQDGGARSACAASIISSPAVTSASLLASATVRPASTAAMTGSSPAQPTIAAITQSASPAAASASASRPAAARQSAACQPSLRARASDRDRR